MKNVLLSILIPLFLFSSQTQAGQVDASKLKKKKQTPQGLYLTAKEAHTMLKSSSEKILFVDVRSQPELEFVGYANRTDVNIPYVTNDFNEFDKKKSRYKKEANSNFTVDMEKQIYKHGLTKNSKIILMCRSGSRSAKAATLLSKVGYNNVYSVVDGFEGGKAKSGPTKGQRTVNGWKNAGLPWSYKLNLSKTYLD